MNSNKIFYASLIWALLMFFAIHFLKFPGSVPDFEEASGGGALFDNAMEFSADGIYQRLESFGDKGRENYRFRNLSTDLILPLSLFPFLFLWMRRSTERFMSKPAIRRLLLSLPLMYVVFDFIENVLVVVLIDHYPQHFDGLASTLAYVTILKRLGVFSSLGVLFALLNY
ncbi:MAG TPA: hypothetical protein VE954_18520 [Oligoflexus sp.]|uniref:hypothetical protein n=1 Tax=Oligoflexus sp. TaxID=1971216 RepID=UPI002D3A48FC|nr:hypothetical protein [Oligoflexus sp.]HYX35096.1 hypothetical protein [Oligoflexus sp.]